MHFRLLLLFSDSVGSLERWALGLFGPCCSLATPWTSTSFDYNVPQLVLLFGDCYKARGGLALWLWLLSGNFVASPGWAAVCFKLLLLFGDLVASPSAGLLRTPDFLQRSQLSPAGVECSVYSCLDCR